MYVSFYNIFTELFIPITITLVPYGNCEEISDVIPTNTSTDNWAFKDYIIKFKPSRVWDQINVNNKTRRHIYDEEFNIMYNGIDETDELLSLKVPNGNPKVVLRKDGRRWVPPGGISDNKLDNYSLKRRFLELMKQAIYQARNRMVIMQTYRTTYRHSPIYKMGFLMGKTDQAVKTFARYTFKSFMGCFYVRLRWYYSLLVKELVEAFERELDLWFDIEILIDLILINDGNCRRMLNQVMTNRKQSWQFYD